MAKKKKPSKDRDELPHTRESGPGDPAKGIAATIIEYRGIRTFSKDLHATTSLAASDIVMSDVQALGPLWILGAAAEREIVQAGAPSYHDIVQSHPEIIDALPRLEEWFSSIVEQHGALSRVTTAAQWLLLCARFQADYGPDEEEWASIARLCDAWNWWYFELTNKHALAYAGFKVSGTLEAGPRARAAAREVMEKVIEAECTAFLSSEQGKNVREAKRIAGFLLERVNKIFRERDLPEYKEDTLRRRIKVVLARMNGQSSQK